MSVFLAFSIKVLRQHTSIADISEHLIFLTSSESSSVFSFCFLIFSFLFLIQVLDKLTP